MNQSTLEALLGRSLTPIEVTNLTLYLDIANESLDDLLCTLLGSVKEERYYDVRAGYKTVFVDILTATHDVKLNGNAVTDYELRQWDRRDGSWYNSLVFDNALSEDDVVSVVADWGFATTPNDMNVLLAGLFDLVTKKSKVNAGISSKQVEDFRITFNVDNDLDDEFYNKYRKTISKYSQCQIPNVQSGSVGNVC